MRFVFLTGAGISVASGIRPFRGPGGLWNDQEVARLSDAATLRTDPQAVIDFWNQMKDQVDAAEPNPAHFAIAELEDRLRPGDELTLITTNVDGLHQRAGSRNVIEFHGSLHRTRPVGERVRPDIVLFGEPIPNTARDAAFQAARYADVFIAVGTSAQVRPASHLVKKPFYKGARTIFVNPDGIKPRYFRQMVTGRAEEMLPTLLKELY
ncbi:MAG: NAD-dependent deacylase [Cyanobacteria bacterium]|nr:NAD-dependent deacylase [Cyanobacteriota bacterium]